MEPKPGIKTTEFWFALGAAILVSVGGIYADSDLAKLAGAIGTALIAAGYGFARTAAKKAASMLLAAALLTLPGCWMFQRSDTQPAVDLVSQVEQKLIERDTGERKVISKGGYQEPVRLEIERELDKSTTSILADLVELKELLIELGGVNFKGLSSAALDIWTKTREVK